MDNYSKVLEFFMENGITLNSNQLEELKSVCNEVSNDQINLIHDRITDMSFRGKNGPASAIRKYNKEAAKQSDLANISGRNGSNHEIYRARKDKATEALYDALDKDEEEAHKLNDDINAAKKDSFEAYHAAKNRARGTED